MEYPSYCKRNGDNKTSPKPKKQIWKKGVTNHEEEYENNGKKLFYKQSGCFAACGKWKCTWRSAEKKFLYIIKCISQIFLGNCLKVNHHFRLRAVTLRESVYWNKRCHASRVSLLKQTLSRFASQLIVKRPVLSRKGTPAFWHNSS